MAKTITIKLSPQIIADFESCFTKKVDEVSYLYKEITQQIDKSVGNVFQNKTCNIRILENGVTVSKHITLDELDFYKTEIKSNPSWVTEDIAGDLIPYEYVVGEGLWDKIYHYCVLFFIINKTFNVSVIADNNYLLEKMKLENKISLAEIKKIENIYKTQEKKLDEIINNECIEAYLYNLFSKPIQDKIKINEKILLDKEFADLNKPTKNM